MFTFNYYQIVSYKDNNLFFPGRPNIVNAIMPPPQAMSGVMSQNGKKAKMWLTTMPLFAETIKGNNR